MLPVPWPGASFSIALPQAAAAARAEQLRPPPWFVRPPPCFVRDPGRAAVACAGKLRHLPWFARALPCFERALRRAVGARAEKPGQLLYPRSSRRAAKRRPEHTGRSIGG